jgi:hypothetical protein
MMLAARTPIPAAPMFGIHQEIRKPTTRVTSIIATGPCQGIDCTAPASAPAISVAWISTPGVLRLTAVAWRSPIPCADAPTNTIRSRNAAGSMRPMRTSVAEI